MRKTATVIWLVVMWPVFTSHLPGAHALTKQVRGEVKQAAGYLQKARSDLTVRNLGGVDLSQVR